MSLQEFLPKQPPFLGAMLGLMQIVPDHGLARNENPRPGRDIRTVYLSAKYRSVFPDERPQSRGEDPAGALAKARFEATGAVDYAEIVSLTDSSAGFPWKAIHDWYQPWTTEKWPQPSLWDNRYATMRDADLWAFDLDDHISGVSTPCLMVHGEMSDGGVEAAQHVYERLACERKTFIVFPGTFHTLF